MYNACKQDQFSVGLALRVGFVDYKNNIETHQSYP